MRPAPGATRRLTPAVALGLAGLLGGCAALNPAGWFHKQEGGVIAQQKGPLPGANKPYPNLATVPPPPQQPDLAALQHITSGLISDRENAHLLAESAPLPDPSRPSTAPALFGVGTLPPPAPPPPGTGAASASLPAVTTPAAPPHPEPPPQAPAKAPVAPVTSAALPAPAAASSPAPTVAAPTVPAAPPPPPNLTQAGLPAAAPAAPAAAAPPPPPAMPGPTADRVAVPFAPGSAVMPTAALPALRALAARRGNRTIEALGQGDAASATPQAQDAAVKLGLARAHAIAATLEAAGVPGSAIQIRSAASGKGGTARLE
jgi:hypothetical protein